MTFALASARRGVAMSATRGWDWRGFVIFISILVSTARKRGTRRLYLSDPTCHLCHSERRGSFLVRGNKFFDFGGELVPAMLSDDAFTKE